MGKNAPIGTPGRRQRRTLAAAALFAAVVASPAAGACGYENPDHLALGLLNWIYPEALHVRSAVWQAENDGLLPPRSATSAKDLLGSGFRRAAGSMTALGERMNGTAAATGKRPSLSVVLIPAVMWTNYTPGNGGYVVATHADGPAKGDVVVVTDEKVIRALIDGSLDAATAERYGLVRYYGRADGQHEIRSALAGLKTAPQGADAAIH